MRAVNRELSSRRRIRRNKNLVKTAKSNEFYSDICKSEKYCNKFVMAPEHFCGFFDNNSKSEDYNERFERFRKSYFNPVVVIERLPENVVQAMYDKCVLENDVQPVPFLDGRTLQSSRSLSRHPAKKCKPSDSDVEGLARVDLSDGLALKKFCELKSISLDDSDSDNEAQNSKLASKRAKGENQVAMNFASSPVVSCVTEDSASSSIVPCIIEDCALSPVMKSPVSACVHPASYVATSAFSVLAPSASGVSENPVPSGVQALNELGFLDNESSVLLQFGKEHPSENIWSDVLDFGDADESGMEDGLSPQDHAFLPLLSEDCIHLDSEKPIEVSSLSSDTALLLSDKEYLTADPLLSNERNEDPSFKIPKSNPSRTFESEFLTSLIRPNKMPSNVPRQRRSKGNVHRQRRSKGKIERGKKYNLHSKSTFQGGASGKRRANCEFDNTSNGDMGKIGSAEDASKTLKPVSRKDKPRDCPGKTECVVKADSKEVISRTSTWWITRRTVSPVGSEQLYRDLSTIPYILKCNLQNRCRKCKNMNPCANANKKFKLFWTLTVGVGRKLSEPLMETFLNPRDSCVISKTSAYIAASAVCLRNTTILVPASLEAVQKIFPIYHSKLLMQLVAETVEIDKKEKRSNSDMAIAETLQFKRAKIAMKSSFPFVDNQDPPQPKQPTPSPQRPMPIPLVTQSIHPGSPFSYKSNRIIGVKSKNDNTFRLVKKCLVSILPKHLNKRPNKMEEAANDEKSCDPTPKRIGSLSSDKCLEPNASLEKRAEITTKSDEHLDALALSIPAKSLGIAVEPSIDIIGRPEKNVNGNILPTIPSSHRTNSIRNSPPKRSRAIGNEPSMESPVKKLLLDGEKFKSNSYVSHGASENKTAVLSELGNDSLLKLADPHARDVPSEVESIDLTVGDDETVDLTGEKAPKWSVVCSSRPELGFIRVRIRNRKLWLDDKSVILCPLKFYSIWELSAFLDTRLAEPTRTPLKWILVTSGYLSVKEVTPTNPNFWLKPSFEWVEPIRAPQNELTSPVSGTAQQQIIRPASSAPSRLPSKYSLKPIQRGKVNPTVSSADKVPSSLSIPAPRLCVTTASRGMTPRVPASGGLTPRIPASGTQQVNATAAPKAPVPRTQLFSSISATKGLNSAPPPPRMQQPNPTHVPAVPAASPSSNPRPGKSSNPKRRTVPRNPFRPLLKQIVITPGSVEYVTPWVASDETGKSVKTKTNSTPSGSASSQKLESVLIPPKPNPLPSHRPILIIRKGSSSQGSPRKFIFQKT